MNNILRDSSPAKLINANEGNLSAWIPIFGILSQSYLDNPLGVKRSITDLPLSLFNSVVDARFTPDQIDAAIQTVVSDAKAQTNSRKTMLLRGNGALSWSWALGLHRLMSSEKKPGVELGLSVYRSLGFQEYCNFDL